MIGFDYGKYIEFGKELYNLDLRYGGIKEAIEQGVKADIIILSHIVEHFTDPVAELKRLRKLFTSEGICYIETPGVLNIHSSYISLMRMLQNAHTYSFSKVTLEYLMNKCGYGIEYSDEYNHMLCKPSNTTLTAEIDPDHSREVIEYLKDCEKKRRLRSILKSTIVISLKAVGLCPFVRKLYRKVKA